MRRACMIILTLAIMGSGIMAAEAGDKPKIQLKFKTDAGEKAFLEGQKAFMAKEYKEASTKLKVAMRSADGPVTKKEVFKWVTGLKGLQNLLIIEKRKDRDPASAYVNAQQQYLGYYANPAGKFFLELIQELENPQKQLITKVETFEYRGGYDPKYGRSYAYKAKTPQFVIHGERSLRWECFKKERGSQALVISKFPRSCVDYKYIAFWMYGTKGKSTKLQLYLKNAPAKGKKTASRFDGFQAILKPHVGWKYITLDLEKDFSKRGAGSMTKVSGLQFQLPSLRPNIIYLDEMVLVKKSAKK